MTIRMLILATVLALAACAEEAEYALKVCMTIPVSHPAWAYTARARAVAGEILREAGVAVLWQTAGKNCVHDRAAIMVRVRDRAPANAGTHAAARAYPYGSTVVEVFLDRIADGRGDRLGPLLGHVVAHEIGHVLEGIARHSEHGVMKACWSDEEQRAMNARPMSFAPEDIDMIRIGMAQRQQPLSTLKLTEKLGVHE
jgi:hypothetical protein